MRRSWIKKPPTSDELVVHWLKELKLAINNLLVDNKNFHNGDWNNLPVYFRDYNLVTYVAGPLKNQAGLLQEKDDHSLRTLGSELARDHADDGCNTRSLCDNNSGSDGGLDEAKTNPRPM